MDNEKSVIIMKVSRNDWNNIVLANLDTKIYHLYEWGILLNTVHNHKIFYLKENSAILPLALVDSKIFGRRLISLPFADYGGPVAASIDDLKKILEKIKQLAKNLNVDYVEIRAPPEKYHSLLEEQGFVRREDYFTFIINLDRSVDELWTSIGKKNRNMVRKAKKSGVVIKEAKSKEDLKAFYYLYLKTMKKLGSPPQPYAYFEKIWDLFYPDHLLIPIAMLDNIPIAAGLFFLYKDKIQWTYGCSLKEYLTYGPNNLILWYVIEWGSKNGFKSLDLGRTRENAGNVLFKKRWGGEKVTMPYFYLFYKKELDKPPEVEYKLISKLWAKFMPEFIANRIGPWIIKQIG